jgi:hypothetical protein
MPASCISVRIARSVILPSFLLAGGATGAGVDGKQRCQPIPVVPISKTKDFQSSGF